MPGSHQHLVNHRAISQTTAGDDYKDDHGMRIGRNYQAPIPQFIAFSPAPQRYEEEKAVKVWSPQNSIPEHILEEYIAKAKEKYSYNMEQALGMLSWHKFDLNRAYADLPNFVPYPDEWSVEDKVLFEQAYQFHEKQFSKIKQMLPDKSMANLIKYYYSWKKTRTRASLMERQTRRFALRKQPGSEVLSDEEEEENNDENKSNGDKEKPNANVGEASPDSSASDEEYDGVCCLCKKQLRVMYKNECTILAPIITLSGDKDYCVPCYEEVKRSGVNKTEKLETGDCFYMQKNLLFTRQDIQRIVDGGPQTCDIILKEMDSKIQNLKSKIQTDKQVVSQIKDKIQPIARQIEELSQSLNLNEILPPLKHNRNWVPEESELIIQGIRRYGTDFDAISEVVRTKNADSIRAFYATNKDRLNLQLLVEKHDEDNPTFNKIIEDDGPVISNCT